MAYLFELWLLLPTISLVIILLKLFFFTKTNPKLNLPPSPPRLPIIGNLHQLGKNPHISLLNLARKHGPILSLNIGQVPTIVISSARLAKEVLKTHDLSLASRPKIFGAKYLFYNCTDMVFSPYGPYWRYIRKVCILEVLSVKRVQSFGSVREEEVSRLVRRLAEPYPNTVNMSKVLGLYSNDVVCRVSFGRDFTEGGDFDRKGFQKLLEEYQELLGGLGVGDFFPSMESVIGFFSGTRSRLVRTSKKFDELFDQIVGEHLNPKRERLETVKDLVDVLLDIQRNGSGDDDISLTMDNVKALILDMFAAGTDTTFIVLDWAMTEMITNPETLKKAQTEVRELLGDRKTVSELDIPKLPYMKAVIKETFRLHPPAPVLVPRESMDHVKIDGYDVPSKTRIFINAWAIGRDPQSWEDPDRFYPDRFLDSSIDFRGQDYELIPFGAGRRMCPAIAFGTAIVEIALAQILHSFDWELPRGVRAQDLDMTEVFGITMHRKYGLEVLAKPRFV